MTEDEMAGWHHQLDGHDKRKLPGLEKTEEIQGGFLENVDAGRSWTNRPFVRASWAERCGSRETRGPS